MDVLETGKNVVKQLGPLGTVSAAKKYGVPLAKRGAALLAVTPTWLLAGVSVVVGVRAYRRWRARRDAI
jgi:hypothetical protein